MGLLPSVSVTEFKEVLKHGLKDIQSMEVTFNGEHYFTVIIPPHGDPPIAFDIMNSAYYLGARANAVVKLSPYDVLKKETADASI